MDKKDKWNRISEINRTVNALNEERAAILNDMNATKEERIKELDWCKDCEGHLQFTGFHCAGLPAYKILLCGKTIETTRSIGVFGDDPHYQNNISYNRDHDGYALTTSDYRTLVKFLSTVKFKDFHYPESYYQLLVAAKELKSRCTS